MDLRVTAPSDRVELPAGGPDWAPIRRRPPHYCEDMELRSDATGDGSTVELPYVEPSCGGENIRPDLRWSGAPNGAKSYTHTRFDPDAPTGSGWWHWVAFDIPDDVTALDAGAELPAACRFNPLAQVLASASFTATFAVAG